MSFEDRICLPPLNLIHRRPRLLNLLTQYTSMGKSFVTIEAPGGYGKSVLLADFAQTTNLPVCWCTVQTSDREPAMLLRLLAYALVDRFYELNLTELLALIEPGDIPRSILQLSQRLTTLGAHLIIIDDYHNVAGPGSDLIMHRLWEYFPETSRFIVAGQNQLGPIIRQTTILPELAPQTTTLSKQILAFTAEEVQALLLKRIGFQLDLAQAEMLRGATEGNGAQILLNGRAMQAYHLKGCQPPQEINPHDLHEELFEKQPVEVQNFLLATSVLPEVTPRLANQLLGTDSAANLIGSLGSTNIFISPAGAGYKYHPHFAQFLQTRLTQEPEQHYHLSTRAARLMIDNARFEEALQLYLSCQAWPETADFLEAQGRYFIDTGQAERLERWLAPLPEALIQQRPRLLLLRGQLGLNSRLGETPDPIFELCGLAEVRFLEQSDRPGLAEAGLVRSARLRTMGHHQGAMRLAIDSLDQLIAVEANDALIAQAIQNRAVAYSQVGNLAAALTDTRQALEMFVELGDSFNAGCCHHEIGEMLTAQGKLQRAQHHLHQAIQTWESQGNALKLAASLNSLGNVLTTLGRHSDALQHFRQSFEVARQLGAKHLAAIALTGSGAAYLGLNAFDKAMRAYQHLEELAVNDFALEIQNRINMGECHYRQRNLFEAFELAAQAKALAGEAGLTFERGLATALQGKIYVTWAEYEASFHRFAEALAHLSNFNVLEQMKVRLWWGYSLLLDLRASAAFEQLRTAINLILTVDELRYGLGQTILETQQLLYHFLYNHKTPPGLQNSLELLLQQLPTRSNCLETGLHFFTFGHPTVVVNGTPKHFSHRGRSRKLPEILAYLLFVSRDRGCRWDELSTAIWPDLGPESASTRFHQSIKRLRDVILEDQNYILVQDDYYQINPAYAHWCDLLVFEKLFDRIASLKPEESLELQLEIIDLYQGEFLTGFDLEGWGRLYSTQCEARFLRTVKMASDQLLQTGQPWKALMVAKQGLNQDYFREDLHHNVLKAYGQLGLRSELHSHYEQMQEIFERELGDPPQPETDQLYQMLRGEA